MNASAKLVVLVESTAGRLSMSVAEARAIHADLCDLLESLKGVVREVPAPVDAERDLSDLLAKAIPCAVGESVFRVGDRIATRDELIQAAAEDHKVDHEDPAREGVALEDF